jgi:hypothetical protein
MGQKNPELPHNETSGRRMLKPSVEIFNYWNELRGSADAPLRSEISPSSIRTILPNVFILDGTSANRLRFRLAGTAVCSLFGRELRGQSFASLWSHSQQSDPVASVDRVMSQITAMLVRATGHAGNDRRVPLEITLLPLCSPSARCDKVLGCLAPAVSAPWLGAEPLGFLIFDQARPVIARSSKDGTMRQMPTSRSLVIDDVAGLKAFAGGTIDRDAP